MRSIILILLMCSSIFLYAQNESEINPDGIVFPRMDTMSRNALSPIVGQCLYNTDDKQVECWNGMEWCSLNLKIIYQQDCLEPDLVYINGIPVWSNNDWIPQNELTHRECDCYDGMDDDGDGLIDCADPDCSLDECCMSECNCCDGIDNDNDGMTDAQDTQACPTTSSIGSHVFEDANNSSFFESGELGLSGVTVNLFTENQDFNTDTPVATAITDANGSYAFNNLVSCTYYIQVLPLSGYSSSSQASSDPYIDNDDNGYQGDTNNDGIFDGPITSSLFTLGENESNQNMDFGLVNACIATFECDCNDNVDNDGDGDADCLDFTDCICADGH